MGKKKNPVLPNWFCLVVLGSILSVPILVVWAKCPPAIFSQNLFLNSIILGNFLFTGLSPNSYFFKGEWLGFANSVSSVRRFQKYLSICICSRMLWRKRSLAFRRGHMAIFIKLISVYSSSQSVDQGCYTRWANEAWVNSLWEVEWIFSVLVYNLIEKI